MFSNDHFWEYLLTFAKDAVSCHHLKKLVTGPRSTSLCPWVNEDFIADVVNQDTSEENSEDNSDPSPTCATVMCAFGAPKDSACMAACQLGHRNVDLC